MFVLLKLFNPLLGIRILTQHRDLLMQILKRNIASRYRGSVLGLVWSFAHPLMMLAVYTFVFGIVFKSRWGGAGFGDNNAAFPMIMFCGMAVFNVFAESVNSTSLVFGLAWFVLLLIGTVLLLHQISWTMLLFPFTLLPLLLISCGVSLFIASLGVYLRDIQQLISILTQMLFFMTPIFYPISIVPEKLRWILEFNPLSPIVEETRKVLLYGQLPDPGVCLTSYVLSFVVFQLGLAWFMKTKKGFADVL